MTKKRQATGLTAFLAFQRLIEFELNDLTSYINETSGDLQSKQQDLEKQYDEASEEVAHDPDIDIHPAFEDELNKYFKVFPVYTYNPLLLTIYGQFESWLKELCDMDARKGFTLVKVSDLAGMNYIEKSRKYLTIVAGIALDNTGKEWIRISEIQRIRNCIAHNASNIVKDKNKPVEKQDLFQVLSKDTAISLNKKNGDFYIKDKAFLLAVIELIRNYLFEIIERLKNRNVVARNATMPFNNAQWGQEKTESLLSMIISSIDMLDENEKRTDEFRDSDLKGNLRGQFGSMSTQVTKLYAFFSNGVWEVKDADLIIKEKKKGLGKLKQLYGVTAKK